MHTQAYKNAGTARLSMLSNIEFPFGETELALQPHTYNSIHAKP